MANKREKGKIPHSEWPSISARYAKGEAIASIARHYGCTAPAIRYIVNRNQRPKVEDAIEPPTYGASVGAHPSPAKVAASSESRTASAERAGDAAVAFDVGIRERVGSDIAAFLVALDAVVAQPSPDVLSRLLTATDQLMRAAARTRIELERMLASDVAVAHRQIGALRTVAKP